VGTKAAKLKIKVYYLLVLYLEIKICLVMKAQYLKLISNFVSDKLLVIIPFLVSYYTYYILFHELHSYLSNPHTPTKN